jgi:Tol biopolymer transport system component
VTVRLSFILVLLLAACGAPGGADSTALPTSPAGPGQIAFVSDRDGNQEIYRMNADGSEQVNLSRSLAADWFPAWSPEGSRIAFVSDRDGQPAVYVMNADGTGQARLSDLDGLYPAWSPDGQRIAFFAAAGENLWQLVTVDMAGSGRQALTEPARYDGFPAWSPDGRQLAFNCYRGSSDEICVVNADGSGLAQLTGWRAVDDYPAWSPDGRWIAFASARGLSPNLPYAPGWLTCSA